MCQAALDSVNGKNESADESSSCKDDDETSDDSIVEVDDCEQKDAMDSTETTQEFTVKLTNK